MEIQAILSNIGTLIMLIILQMVLGFDNLLYIALESKKAPHEKQSYVRKLGISIAIILRLLLLFFLISLVQSFEEPIINSNSSFFSCEINLHG